MVRPSRKASAAAFTAIARQADEEMVAIDGEVVQRRISSRGKKPAAEIAVGKGPAEAEPVSSSSQPRKAKLAAVAPIKDEDVDAEPESELSDLSALSEQESVQAPPPKKKRRTKKQIAEDEAAKAETATTKGKGRKGKQKAKVEDEDDELVEEEDNDEAEGSSPKKTTTRTRKPKVTEPVVYEIPDVPTRDFRTEGGASRTAERAQGYQGRLGYACLNTILRAQKPSVFCSRTTRIKSIEEKGLDFVRELALANVRDIVPMLEWNEAHGIKFMRLSSEMFPFATHLTYGYDFVSFAKEELAKVGEVARRLGHRLSMHPGQFCQLGTPKKDVLEASIRELEMHAQILDALGMDQDSVMILHGGGVYGEREETVARIKNTIATRLKGSARSRLVLENDELSYSVDELLPICKELKVPLVLDFHHDMLRPSSRSPAELIPEILEIWKERGITPKFHLSEPRPGAKAMRERRAHSDRCTHLPADLPANADLMIEAKDKEQAVFELFRIYGLVDVQPFWSDLRPPAADQSTSTAGRKRGIGANGSGSVTEQEKALRTLIKSKKLERKMERKRAVAEGRTPPPEGDSDLDDWSPAKDRPAVATQLEVLEEMRRDADWIRNELREGRDRRAYGDQEGDEEGEEMDEDEDAETVGSTNGSPVKKMTKAKAKAKPAKTTALRVDEQSAGAQEDLVAVVTDAPSSAGGAGPSETASDSSASGAVGLRIDDDGKVALVVKPAVAADPSAEVTPTEAVAVAGGQGRSTGKRRR
ncbi:unnamed protein product [Tilletia controversa]|uniref:UV-damage endonuclease n=3 Tax=Tilletia TaxID=13289 RepID=A0A8X7MM21_9BASI|nr:hypothetical protein CF336_g7443 [Tilletia laevis]KAE8187286.1 hypothetical protein CF328_g6965 [Tilletia controversa]KAE8248511.1 hypothetical protein A4X03_0g6760 [Tilletia caries]KAE8188610.1 hypothetical protein CF335_g6854 [Tilletia laevis]KAE8240900.1 hypothetical protein A4X06_0g7744 [Tilletia controversa]